MAQVVKSGKEGLRGDNMGMVDYKKSRTGVRLMTRGEGSSSTSVGSNRERQRLGILSQCQGTMAAEAWVVEHDSIPTGNRGT